MPGRASTPFGIAAVVLAAALWGSMGTVQALLPPDRQPPVVAAARLLVGTLTLTALAFAMSGSLAGLARLPRATLLGAGLAMALYNAIFFVAVVDAGVGVGTALSIGSAPVWVTAYEMLVLRRRPSTRQLAGQALCIVGAALLVLSADAGAAPAALGASLLACVAGAFYATYSLLTSRLAPLAPPATIAAGTFAIAALAMSPAYLLFPAGWLLAPKAALGIVFLGIVATGIAYALYTWGLRHVAPAAAVTLGLVEPLTAWVLATAIVGEPLTATKAAGAALLFAGLWIVATAITRREAASTP